MKKIVTATAFAALILTACSQPTEQDSASSTQTTPEPASKSLQIYSARHYDSDKALYAAFEEQTGVQIDVREAKSDQLLETMKAEGQNSPADLIIAADAGAVWRFQDAGLTQGYTTPALEEQVPDSMREAEGNWYGLSNRVRLVAYDPERITEDQVDEWVKLADPALQGEICVRASSNIYNLSLMAELIDRLGETEAQAWAEGVVANMARAPQGGDTDQIRAVAAGECSVAIVNHYYWSRLAASSLDRDTEAAAATALVIPSFGDGQGAHVNITGIAISASAEDPALAAQFIEFLLTESGQTLLTSETQEVPLARLGQLDLPNGTSVEYTVSPTPLATFGENQADAQRIYDLAGWN
ncbi:extracellular solute-binding protein [Hyphomonas sp. FCG-A18]|uniref:extracellular solute-binding protein n=1 Tax=Hyphomonas sp. FCG-A18 TaxID=3080019 RepID=UPI002B2F6E1E|nr:extracellular solute-binding protein [Hyphomonas sp. FCG-A18]